MWDNGSGISTAEPKPEDFEDQEDFKFAWEEWKAEYPHLTRSYHAERYDLFFVQ